MPAARYVDQVYAPVGLASLMLHAAVLVTGVLYEVADSDDPLDPGIMVAFVGCMLLLMALDRAHTRLARPGSGVRTVVMLLVLRGVLLEFAVAFDGAGYAEFLWITIPFAAYLSLGRAAGHTAGCVAVAVLIGRLTVCHPGWPAQERRVFDVVMFTAGTLFALLMAAVVEAHRRGRTEAEALVADLEESQRTQRAYAERIAELAAAEERNRLARDIHDSVGHHLTVVAVQLEKARRVGAQDRGAADNALSHAQAASRSALAEVRRSVAALRVPTATGFSLSDELRALADKVRSDGLVVDLDITGSEEDRPYRVLVGCYRVAQECLTNVRKHAFAGRVEVSLRFDGRGVTLTVADDGRGFRPGPAADEPPLRGGGFGLRGMRERMAEIGGSLSVRSTPGRGTTVVATVAGTAGASQHEEMIKEPLK